jgi:hypothetical protein
MWTRIWGHSVCRGLTLGELSMSGSHPPPRESNQQSEKWWVWPGETVGLENCLPCSGYSSRSQRRETWREIMQEVCICGGEPSCQARFRLQVRFCKGSCRGSFHSVSTSSMTCHLWEAGWRKNLDSGQRDKIESVRITTESSFKSLF